MHILADLHHLVVNEAVELSEFSLVLADLLDALPLEALVLALLLLVTLPDLANVLHLAYHWLGSFRFSWNGEERMLCCFNGGHPARQVA